MLLAGCNGVFGLAPVTQRDASYYDAHVDAPFECPPIGTAPSFDHDHLVQVAVDDCGYVTLSEDRSIAMATCIGTFASGPFDGTPLVPFTLPAMPNQSYRLPRLAPDGTTATILRYTIDPSGMTPTTTEVVLLSHDDDGWHAGATIIAASSAFTSLSPLTRGPNAHLFVGDSLAMIHEYVDTGSGWVDMHDFTVANYARLSQPVLSPDGLRMWWADPAFDVRYADRATIDAPFDELGLVPGGTGLGNAFIASDCGAIYFNTLGRIWRAPRI